MYTEGDVETYRCMDCSTFYIYYKDKEMWSGTTADGYWTKLEELKEGRCQV